MWHLPGLTTFSLTNIVFLLLFMVIEAQTQSVVINVSSEKQTIRGFGGMNCPTWGVDLTADQAKKAFGNGPDQLGMTILRIMVPNKSSNWYKELPTAKAAAALGAVVFASPWFPPDTLKEMVDGKAHLKKDMYSNYADHLNSFITYMKENEVDLYAVSIQNEPDYGQWTDWTSDELVTFLKQNASTLQTRVIAPESFEHRKATSDPILNDSAALANLDILGAHLYGTQLQDYPYPLFKEKGKGKELWMTEVYTDSKNDADLWPMALDVATNIHHSLVDAEFNAYVWWYIRRSYGMLKEDGGISKRGYCMAHFCKFVRPGYVRIDATPAPIPDVYVSAYKGKDSIIVIAVNTSPTIKTISVTINGCTARSFAKYTTSESKSLLREDDEPVTNGTFSGILDAQSVTTWAGIFNSQNAKKFPDYKSAMLKEFSKVKIFDLRGRQINCIPDELLNSKGKMPNHGLYIITSDKGSNTCIKCILNKSSR